LLSFGVIPGWRPAAVGGYIAGVMFIDIGRRIHRAIPDSDADQTTERRGDGAQP
jgi:hypothetical protein